MYPILVLVHKKQRSMQIIIRRYTAITPPTNSIVISGGLSVGANSLANWDRYKFTHLVIFLLAQL